MIYDDQLMCEQANSFVSGDWLGEYNSKTLTKGVFTPLFIALTYFLNIPFLMGKEIFYGISYIVFTLIISKKIKNKFALILIYLVILLNPVEYSAQLSRAYRAEEYYIELADEINKLCDDGAIESRSGKIVSNSCRFDLGDIIETIIKMPETIKYQYSLDDVSMMVINSEEIIGLEVEKEKFEKITNQPVVTFEYNFQKSNSMKIKILEIIKNIYESVNPYLFYMSVVALIVLILCNINKLNKIYEEIIILLSLVILYASRIFIITFTKEMMFEEAFNVSYLSCIYGIQFLFGIISIVFLIKDFRSRFNERRNQVNNIDSCAK